MASVRAVGVAPKSVGAREVWIRRGLEGEVTDLQADYCHGAGAAASVPQHLPHRAT